jgi:hypothetical protein
MGDDGTWHYSERTRNLLARAKVESDRLRQLRAGQTDIIRRILDGMPEIRRNRRRFWAQTFNQLKSGG